MTMRWSNLAFFHWRVPPDAVRRTLPDELDVDLHEDAAWLGLVPFTMPVIRPTWWPAGVTLPRTTEFHECNVRTYVTCRGIPGVWFYSLDAGSPHAVIAARMLFRLPYFRARIRLHVSDRSIEYDLQRRRRTWRGRAPRMRAQWTVGERLDASTPGSFEYFLTERYSLFSAASNGRIHRGRIHHDPWPLRSAHVHELEDELCASAGFEALDHMPHVMAADPIDVRAWRLETMPATTP